MFRFTIYKNSILATICSLFGTAFIAMAVVSLFSGELEILPTICMVGIGIGLVILAGEISERKERKKRAKAARQAAQPSAGNAAGHCSAAAPRKAAVSAISVDKFLLFAKIGCVLTAVCSFWAYFLYNSMDLDIPFDDRLPLVVLVEGILYLMLLAGCFTKAVSKLYVPGFLGLAGFNAFVGVTVFLDSVGESMLILVFLLKVLAYLLMAMLIFVSQYRGRQIPVVVWFVPTVLLAVAGLKMASDNYALYLLLSQRLNDGVVLSARPEYPQLYAQLLGAAVMGLIGYACYLMTPGYVVDTTPVGQDVRINCPHCHYPNSADSVFCQNCGQKLIKPQAAPAPGFCPQCHHQNTPESLFCQNCGKKLR